LPKRNKLHKLKKIIENIPPLLILFIFFAQSINAQEYTYRNFDTKHGLPSSEVFHAIQDAKGYIWFATDNGVSRYDGYRFTNFDISNGLVNNTVFDIYEDWKGRIWFMALSGRLCYYENNRIKQYRYNHLIDKNTGVRSIPVKKSFYVDSLDNVFLSITHQGILKISSQGEIVNLLDETSSALTIKKVHKENYMMGYLLKSKKKGSISINGNSQTFKHQLPLLQSSQFFANPGAIQNEIVFSINNTILKYDNNTITELKSFANDIIWFSKDKNGNYWLSIRDNGIKSFSNTDFNSGSFSWFLKDKEISSVLIDKENGYWFTTLNNGIYYLPSKEIKTVEIATKKSKNVFSLGVSENNVFLGLEEKQIIAYNKNFDKIDQKFTFYRDEVPLKMVYHKTLKKLVSGTYFLCLLIDENSKRINDLNKKRYRQKKEFDGAIKSLAQGRGNYFWAGTYTGLYKINENGIVYHSNYDDNWKETVYSIYENQDKSLWIGTFKGLWKYQNGEYINFGDKNKLLSYRVNAVHKNNNNLFVGTKGGGLAILDLNDYTTKVIGTKEGLLSNSISSIVQYKNELWLGTNKGINRLVLLKDSVLSISRLDNGSGLVANEINELVIDKSMLYIATRKGFNFIDLDKLKWTKNKPLLHIQQIKINTQDTALKPHYRLTNYQNNIEISYVGISYKSYKNIQYKYQLLPLDKDWKETNTTEINYSNLMPGDYKFRIKAINESGIWSDVNETISFSIDKPFYKKWWFILGNILVIIVFGLLIIQNIIYKIRKENTIRQELKTYTQKAIATQVNPHFIFNSFNSLNHLILKDDKIKSSKFLSKFSTYLRAVLDAVQRELLTLSDELRIAKLYLDLEKFRLKEKFNYELVYDDTIDSKKVRIPGLFIQPLIEKAIWSRLQSKKQNGFAKISIEKHQDYIQVLIEDNGKVGHEKFIGESGDEWIDKRKELLNDLYKGKIVFDFFPNTKVSFDEIGNIVKLKLNIPSSVNIKFR